MTGCEYIKCPDWDGERCTDPEEYVNAYGDAVCKRRSDAIPKVDYDLGKKLDAMTKQRDDLHDALMSILCAERNSPSFFKALRSANKIVNAKAEGEQS